MDLTDKRILVTGSSRGIGKAIALEVARRGAKVVVHGPEDSVELRDAFAEVHARQSEALKLHCELLDPDAVARLFEKIEEDWGGIDVLVNNAATMSRGSVLDLSIDEWDRILAVNLRAPFLCAQYAARGMKKRGTGGAIINISSVHAYQPLRNFPHYSAAKGGLEQLTRCLALELGEYDIRANSVVVGAVATELTPPDRQEAFGSAIPMGRVGRVDEIARMVAFLCSEECVYQTGASICVDGGLTLGFCASRRDL